MLMMTLYSLPRCHFSFSHEMEALVHGCVFAPLSDGRAHRGSLGTSSSLLCTECWLGFYLSLPTQYGRRAYAFECLPKGIDSPSLVTPFTHLGVKMVVCACVCANVCVCISVFFK